MKQSKDKDLYSILGVKPDATQEELRNAYLARTRIIHPDRFDRQRYPKDWQNANDMLMELNEAYSILRNSWTRTQYDNSRSGKRRQQSNPPPPKPQQSPDPPSYTTFKYGELAPGQATFQSLPKNVQSRLLKRQQNNGEAQFQVKLSSLMWNYVFIAVLLCWYWYLFAVAEGMKWNNNTNLWHTGITIAVAGLIGSNCVTILRWLKATLKPYFYITPLYFIKTVDDIVYFRPLSTLKDVSVFARGYKNGSYQSAEVVLKFDGCKESVTLSSKEKVEAFLATIRTYDTGLKNAIASRDQAYFHKHDDFSQVPRAGASTPPLMTKKAQAWIYVLTTCVCGIGLFVANETNEKKGQSRWVRHSTPSNYMTPQQKRRVDAPAYPVQPLPYSGYIRSWTSAEMVAPLEIVAAHGSHYLLKLVDAYSNTPVLTVFVRSGATVEIEVPLGTFEVRYASGNTWYGDEYLFGPDTSYSKADRAFSFNVQDNRISGYTITLYKVTNGNLHTSTIKPTDF